MILRCFLNQTNVGEEIMGVKRAKKPKVLKGNAGGSRTRNLTEIVRNDILDGAIPADSRINEVRLASELNVSRTPVRAVLQALLGEGLVEYKHNRGYFVRRFDLAEILDAFEMRALAEGLSARLAAERGLSTSDEVELEAALRMADEAMAFKDLEKARIAYSSANERFHAIVQGAARSHLVSDVISLCYRIPQTVTKNVMAFTIEHAQTRIEQHRLIYQAIFSRKPKEAEALMFEHVIGIRRDIARAFSLKSANQ